MDPERKSIRVGAAAILCALIVRMFAGGAFGIIVRAVGSPEVASALLYLETGRVVRPDDPTSETTLATEPSETVAPTIPETVPETVPETQPEAAVPAFASTDGSNIRMGGNTTRKMDLSALVQQTLSWNLADDRPAVLIVHTHATESYLNREGYRESSHGRTTDENYNMVSVGDRVAEVLEAGGVKTLHDRTLHDYPNYNGSYHNCRLSIADYLQKYPTIRMVLDIHRDSVENSAGEEMGFRVQVGDKTAAKLMLVVGTDTNLSHPKWQENMALATMLYTQLERKTPGICRPIDLRKERFNQDMTDGSLLIEVGASGNTHEEALLAGELLADAILSLSHGANK